MQRSVGAGALHQSSTRCVAVLISSPCLDPLGAANRRKLLNRIGALRRQIHEEIGATALELGGLQ